MIPRSFAILVCVLWGSVNPVFAQLQGTTTLGIGVSTIRPDAPELSTRMKVRPAIGRVPSRGLGLVVALNWFDADLSGEIVNSSGSLGSLAIRPLMLGLGYTYVNGRIGISPSIVAGGALNTLDIHDDRPDVAVTGTSIEEHVGSISRVVRPAVGVTLALAPRLGVTASAGYLFNRPHFTLRTPAGERRIQLNAGGVVLSAGAVISLF